MLKKVKNKLFSEVKSFPTFYLLLTTILILAFIIRVYRVGDLMGFYYDQGRDALVIWKLWHEGKLFLIGPVTGLAGIFLGPLYYYLIAPFYLIGGGNPVYPAVFLAFLSTLAVLMLYILGRCMHSRRAGIIAAITAAFSYYIMTFGRWLSNPNPILLTSLLLLWCMWRIVDKNNKMTSGSNLRFGEPKGSAKSQQLWEWIGIAFFAGISLQFESASAVFYLPLVAAFSVWVYWEQAGDDSFNIITKIKRILKLVQDDRKVLVVAITAFIVTLLPQIIFNFRHDNILFNSFTKLFFQENAFRGITKFIFEERMKYFWSVFSTKIFPGSEKYVAVFLVFSLSSLFVVRKTLEKGLLKLFLVFLLTPLLFYTFFQGNFGNIYDYYLSGYYLPFILFFSIGLAALSKTYLGKVVVLVFFITFFNYNLPVIRNYLTATPATRPIALEDELGVIDWAVEDVQGRGEFNLDIYVPPVIPHSYDYLYLWRGTERCGEGLCGKVEEQRELLYTLYEEDPPHPERLEKWLGKYEDNTVVEDSVEYGGVTVQRRRRM